MDEETGQSSAVIRILQDLDDTQGPVRNHGNAAGWGQGNEFVEEAWELGEKFYRDWWWCVDRGVVERSNRLRRERGEGGLRAGK